LYRPDNEPNKRFLDGLTAVRLKTAHFKDSKNPSKLPNLWNEIYYRKKQSHLQPHRANEELVSPDNVVRRIDLFVESLDLAPLGFDDCFWPFHQRYFVLCKVAQMCGSTAGLHALDIEPPKGFLDSLTFGAWRRWRFLPQMFIRSTKVQS
jgi:hypothetical protein